MQKIMMVILYNISTLVLLVPVLLVAVTVYLKVPSNYRTVRRYILFAAVLLTLSAIMTIVVSSGIIMDSTATQTLTGLGWLALWFQLTGIALIFCTVLYTVKTVDSRPDEQAGKWSWFAFLLCPVWALVNRVYWGLFSLVPVLGFVVPVYMAMFGNQIIQEKRQIKAMRDGKNVLA